MRGHEHVHIVIIKAHHYLEVLFVRHLQGDDINTTGPSTVASARASDGADDTVLDASKEPGDAIFDPSLEPSYSVECNEHFVGFSVPFFASALNSEEILNIQK